MILRTRVREKFREVQISTSNLRFILNNTFPTWVKALSSKARPTEMGEMDRKGPAGWPCARTHESL